MWHRFATGLGVALALAGGACGPSGGISGQDLEVRFQVVGNGEHSGGFRSRCRLALANRGASNLPASGWTLFFNSPPLLLESLPEEVRAVHVNGDFYRLQPGPSFVSLPPGQSRTIEFHTDYALFNRSAAPAGFYLVWDSDGPSPSQPQPVGAEIVEPFPDGDLLRRSPQDQLAVPTAESRFSSNSALSEIPEQQISPILPTPLKWRAGGSTFQIGSPLRIYHGEGLAGEAAYLGEVLSGLLGSAPEVVDGEAAAPGGIALRVGFKAAANSGPEAYRLSVDPARGVEIVGGGAAGVFYGIQSLLALLPPEAFGGRQDSLKVPSGVVEDAPRFGYRGMHLDVARNFQTAATVKKLLDLMAAYKLNRFHFHLSDDEGWRLPVASLPELTEVGGRRGHTLDESDRLIPALGSGPFPDPEVSHGSGSYSREEYLDILRHARSRHIEVIPEIDLPGHARAAIKAMEARRRRLQASDPEAAARFALADPRDASVYRSVQHYNDNVVNVCQESTYRFIEVVVDELIGLHKEAGVPLSAVHVGGDEVPGGVWEKSPACGSFLASGEVGDVEGLPEYFLGRVGRILAQRGLPMAGWEEIALTAAGGEGSSNAPAPAPENVRAYVWNSVWGWGGEENAYRLANAGYRVVLCNASNLYFDLAYEKDPDELGQAWAGFVDTRKAFEFVPLDLYKSAIEDSLGRRLDPAAYADAVRLTARGRDNISGVQGQLWSEVAKGREVMEYLAFPKLLALAERAWAAPPAWAGEEDPETRAGLLEADWNQFANRLGRRELRRLDHLAGGVSYRLPPPGAKVEDGTLHANAAFPGLEIRYTIDGTEPTAESELYRGPVIVSGQVKLRTFDTRGRSSRTTTPVAAVRK